MAKIISVIIVILLLAGVTAFLIWDMVANNNMPEAHQVVKYIVALCAGTLTIIRLCKNQRSVRRPLSFYEKHYEKELQHAFVTNEKARKKLIECYRLYNEDRQKDALRLADSLKKGDVRLRDTEAIELLRALCYEDLKMKKEAVEAYRNILRLSPRNVTALSNLGLIYSGMGEHETAIHFFEAAIGCDDTYAPAYTNLATLYFKMGDYNKTIELCHRSLELAPTVHQTASLLAICYGAKADINMSDKYYRIAISNGADAKELKKSIESMGDLAAVNVILDKWSALTEKESVYIRLGAKSGKSVVGGRLNERAPLDENGRPMRLLAAIFLSEMPHLVGFPREGALRFYIAENDSYGADLKDPTSQRNFRVLYDEDESRFESGAYNKESDLFPVMGSYRISFKREKESMPLETMGAYELLERRLGVIGDEIEDAVGDRLVVEQSKLGGYPFFAQYDMREGNYEQYDTLLFQLISTDINGKPAVMFGDCGVCNFFISKSDLLRRNFDNVLYTWDCF